MVLTVFLQQPEELVEQAGALVVAAAPGTGQTEPLTKLLEGLSGVEFALDMAEIQSMSAVQVFKDLGFILTRSRDHYLACTRLIPGVPSARGPIAAARELLDAIGRHVYVRESIDQSRLQGQPTGADARALGDSMTEIARLFDVYCTDIRNVVGEVERRP